MKNGFGGKEGSLFEIVGYIQANMVPIDMMQPMVSIWYGPPSSKFILVSVLLLLSAF
jgi:hypothetical protein